MTDPTETARALLYRHGLPEDIIDGALCLHAQELAAVQRLRMDELDLTGQKARIVGRIVDLIDPTLTPAAPAVPAPATDPTALRERIAEALLDHLSRTADIRKGRTGELAFMPEVTDAERTRIAEHLATVLPAPTEQTAECMECNDTGACNGGPCPLRRLAGEAQQDEEQARRRCAHTDIVYGRCVRFMDDHDGECVHEHQPAREARQDPTQDGEAVCIVAGCGHGELAHGVTGCQDCPRGQRAFHLFSLPAVARPGQPETTSEDDDPPVQCWHTEPDTPCDWDVCRQPERLVAGNRGTDPANETR